MIKFALDGRDPSSIAGIQWCHGLFDRPFHPPLPVMGVVRKRDIETHKSRLDLSRYEKPCPSQTKRTISSIYRHRRWLFRSFCSEFYSSPMDMMFLSSTREQYLEEDPQQSLVLKGCITTEMVRLEILKVLMPIKKYRNGWKE